MIPSSGSRLRDYSADSRILYVSALAVALGAGCSVVAWALLKLIALFTNLFYFHQWGFTDRDPWQAGNHWWNIFTPVLGGLIVGLIARFLSPRVRGHGMPEAIETIVFGGGKVQPRVAVLKPVATAISIGSGGPFGAEGPVIITGGAIGSVLAQLLPMTDSERTVLMVAGASAGMAATFNCPMSAVLLAVEILLFEWKPRSLVPVAMACATAGAVRRLLLGADSLLTMAPSNVPPHHQQMIGAVIIGVIAAFYAAVLGKSIQWSEKLFHKLPIHWMWWPAIGGLGIGLGGLVFPRALGVGYTTLQVMVTDGRHTAWSILAGVLVVKTLIWVFSLGSETAGGILAPLLLLGGAMGAALGHLMPAMTAGSWVVVGMTSLLTAAIGCPLTSAMLAFELTRNSTLLIPVLVACMAAYAVSVLVQKRSLLTESLSRRGLHLSREFGVDPLETMLVGQAMHTEVLTFGDDAKNCEAEAWLAELEGKGIEGWGHWQRLFPLVDGHGHMRGLLTRSQMIAAAHSGNPDGLLCEHGTAAPVTVSPRSTLRAAAVAMAQRNLSAFPVIDAEDRFLGIMTITDLLKGRQQQAQREEDRARILQLRWPFFPAHLRAAASKDGVVPPAEQAALQHVDEEEPVSRA